MNGDLTITRMHGADGDSIKVVLHHESQKYEAELTLANFALVITGRSSVPCVFKAKHGTKSSPTQEKLA